MPVCQLPNCAADGACKRPVIEPWPSSTAGLWHCHGAARLITRSQKVALAAVGQYCLEHWPAQGPPAATRQRSQSKMCYGGPKAAVRRTVWYSHSISPVCFGWEILKAIQCLKVFETKLLVDCFKSKMVLNGFSRNLHKLHIFCKKGLFSYSRCILNFICTRDADKLLCLQIFWR